MTTPTTNETWTIGRLLAWTTDYFAEKGVGEPRLTAEVLLAHASGLRRIDLYTRFEDALDAEPLARFRTLIKRAADHEPFAYLVGEKEFYSLNFYATSAVLIPRPETETLVDAVVDRCKAISLDAPGILDLGTGSGCIAVALAKQLPGARVVATDISLEALETARRNSDRHGVGERITFVQADRLDIPAELIPHGGFDVLVSNPPYVSRDDMASLDRTVRDFEPHGALTDDGDGFSFYRAIGAGAPNLVRAGGFVMVEVGDGQAERVVEIMTGGNELAFERTIKDLVTRRERVVVVRRAALQEIGG